MNFKHWGWGSEVKTFMYRDTSSSCVEIPGTTVTSHVVDNDNIINAFFPIEAFEPFSQRNKETGVCISVYTCVCMGVRVNVCTKELERENVHSVCVM